VSVRLSVCPFVCLSDTDSRKIPQKTVGIPSGPGILQVFVQHQTGSIVITLLADNRYHSLLKHYEQEAQLLLWMADRILAQS